MTTPTAIAALTVYLLGLAITFGWQTLTHWRATGTTGYQGLSGQPGSLPWWGGTLFTLALLLGTAAPILTIADLLDPPTVLTHPALAGAGLLAALAGIVLAVAAQRRMGVSWRVGVDPDERTSLVTDGLFTHVRNPFFTGILTATIGLTAMVPTPVSALAVGCLLAAVQIQVRAAEEPYLTATHPLAYQHYAAHAGRFLPGVGRLHTTSEKTASRK